MSARKYTAALFEHVDFKAQAAEIAEKEDIKKRKRREQKRQTEEEEQRRSSNNDSLSGLFSRIFLRTPGQARIDRKPASRRYRASGVSYPRVLLFGDSLTQYAFGGEGGWGAMLADKLQRRADVVVRGFSGYNTRWCRIIVDQIFADESPSLLACVVILLGSNDASLPDCFPKTHVPVDEYESNLSAIVYELTEKHGVERGKIILVTPPPVNRNMLEAEEEKSRAAGGGEGGVVISASSTESAPQPVAYTNESTSRYAAACCRVGEASGVAVLDLFAAMLRTEGGEEVEKEEKVEEEEEKEDQRDEVEETREIPDKSKLEKAASDSPLDGEPHWHSFFCDGIHFSRSGSEFLFSRLWPLVDRRVEKLPFKYPHWRHVDESQPMSSLQNDVDIWDKDFKLD